MRWNSSRARATGHSEAPQDALEPLYGPLRSPQHTVHDGLERFGGHLRLSGTTDEVGVPGPTPGGTEPVDGALDDGALAVPARPEEKDVDSVGHAGLEICHLGLAVAEVRC